MEIVEREYVRRALANASLLAALGANAEAEEVKAAATVVNMMAMVFILSDGVMGRRARTADLFCVAGS